MGTIVVTEFITLDGVVEDPDGGEGSPYGGGRSGSTAARTATASSSTS
jgi:hypothetical protein